MGVGLGEGEGGVEQELSTVPCKAATFTNPAPPLPPSPPPHTHTPQLTGFFKAFGAGSQAVDKEMKRDQWDNHIKSVKEGLSSMNWVMESKPKQYILEGVLGGVDMWANKIRVEHKAKDSKTDQFAFCNSFKELITGLAEYTKNNHMAGVAYNAKGTKKMSDFSPGAAAPAAAPAAPKAAAAAATTKPAGGGMGGLMAELGKKRTAAGDSAATGLKTVSKDQQTWRKEFKGGEPPAPKAAVKPKGPVVKASKIATKPPVFEYDNAGYLWKVEYQTKETNPNGVVNVNVENSNQRVSIYKCDGATVIVNGKCKGITLDGCEKTAVLFDTILSTVETVNCKRLQLQAREMCPVVSIEKTDGCLVYLSKETAETTNFVTSKSSEMNVNWPGDDDEMVEAVIPEQFQHRLDTKTKKISSDISDLYSH